jgi:hypothetical protein
MNLTKFDPKQLETLLTSDVFKRVQIDADEKRMAAHQIAVDDLLARETDTAAIDAARAAAAEARRKFEPIETTYRRAAYSLHEKESSVKDLTWSHEHTCGQLRKDAASHTPPIVGELDRALYFIACEIRGAFKSRVNQVPLLMGGNRERITHNTAQVDAALACVESLRVTLEEMAIQPMASEAIRARLSAESDKLCELAHEAGTMVRHLLPEELRGPGFVDKPEFKGPRVLALPRG